VVASIAVVSAIKLQTALRLELLPATTVVRKATSHAIAVLLPRQSLATSVVKKDTLAVIVPRIPRLAESGPAAAAATATAGRLVPSATSAARSGTLLVHALKLVRAGITRSAVVLRRHATLAVV